MRPKLVVLIVALLNLVTGASFGFMLGSGHASVAVHLHGPGEPDLRDLPGLADGLGLPPEREAKVRAILASCGPRFDEVMREVRPKMAALHEKFLAELGEVLTPDELKRLAAEYRRRHGSH